MRPFLRRICWGPSSSLRRRDIRASVLGGAACGGLPRDPWTAKTLSRRTATLSDEHRTLGAVDQEKCAAS